MVKSKKALKILSSVLIVALIMLLITPLIAPDVVEAAGGRGTGGGTGGGSGSGSGTGGGTGDGSGGGSGTGGGTGGGSGSGSGTGGGTDSGSGSGSGTGGGTGGGSGSGTGGGNSPLDVEGVYIAGVAIAEASVHAGEKPEIQIVFTRGMKENFETNKSEITLSSGSNEQIKIDVSMKQGEDEKSMMYVTPVEGLNEGEFALKLSKDIKANNGNTLEKGQSYTLMVAAVESSEAETTEPAVPEAGAEEAAPIEDVEPIDTSHIGRDIAANHWAKATIETMVQQGIITGDADSGNVRPADNITRQELASLLTRALKLDIVTGSSIAAGDASSPWAADALATLKQSGIMKGDDKGYLNGQAQATRLEVIVMLARANSISSANMSVFDSFSDTQNIPSWAKMQVAGMIEQGHLQGYPDNTLGLDDMIVRAEVFALIDRVID